MAIVSPTMFTNVQKYPVTHYDGWLHMCKTLHDHSQCAISELWISLTKLLAISNLPRCVIDP